MQARLGAARQLTRPSAGRWSSTAPGARRPRWRIPHAWLPGAARRTSTLDLLGLGLTLFTGPAREDWDAALAVLDHPVSVRVRCRDPITARALGIRDGGALLAPPDGNPVAAWPPGTDAAELSGGITSATGRRASRGTQRSRLSPSATPAARVGGAGRRQAPQRQATASVPAHTNACAWWSVPRGPRSTR
jgi:hypothetical protein